MEFENGTFTVIKFCTDSIQNNTIEERVSLLEVQVADIREDITEVDEDVIALAENINFLFDEQVIQDEKLLDLEQETDTINEELDVIDDGLEGNQTKIDKCHLDCLCWSVICDPTVCWKIIFYCMDSFLYLLRTVFLIISTADLQDTTLALDFRVTALEESGGGGDNSSVAELEQRVEALEGTATDHETRISATESTVTGNMFNFLFSRFWHV